MLRLDMVFRMMRHRFSLPVQQPSSALIGIWFPPEVIQGAVRWELRYGLPYRDLEELLAQRRIEVDHVTLFRWVQRFMPYLAKAAGPRRQSVGSCWFVDETYVKCPVLGVMCTGRLTNKASSSTYLCPRSTTRRPSPGSLPGP